jgi:DNA-binding LacI/PurR family transcriptional regulator
VVNIYRSTEHKGGELKADGLVLNKNNVSAYIRVAMVTIYDVAKRAQVSAMTVSRTLNNPELVRPASKAKVAAAIEELGYRQNRAARSLVTQSTGIVKVQLNRGLRGNHLYFSQLFAGMTDVFMKSKLALLISDDDTADYAYDGKIIMGLTEQQRNNLASSHTPKILFGHGPEGIDWIEFDNKAGGRMATEHLAGLGHSRIGFLKFSTPEPYISEREAGYREALADLKLSSPNHFSMIAYDNTTEEGFGAGLRLLKQANVTAVVCCSDQLASGMTQAAQEMGLNVPNDLSIVGFDGIGYERAVKPMLTTVSQPAFRIGEQLATHLVDLISHSRAPGSTNLWIPPQLIENESTAVVSKKT